MTIRASRVDCKVDAPNGRHQTSAALSAIGCRRAGSALDRVLARWPNREEIEHEDSKKLWLCS
jgi:hypothetical protein